MAPSMVGQCVAGIGRRQSKIDDDDPHVGDAGAHGHHERVDARH